MGARREPLVVAATVVAAYAVWVVWEAAHRPLVQLARVGSEFQGRSAGSPAIDGLDDAVVDDIGYDGQFFLYIAVDPSGAEGYLDAPAYRYSRIVYPLVARATALGLGDAIPVALTLVGVAGVGIGTLALALLLRGRGLSPWYAAMFGLYPGLFFAVWRGLAEPLAYGLCALGLLAFERRHLLGSVAVFSFAGLTRETTLLFPLALAVWIAVRGRRLREAGLLAASVLPYLALRTGLWIWLGDPGNPPAQRLEFLPFGGLAGHWPWGPLTVEQLYSVIAPALLAVALAAAAHASGRDLAMLAANVLVLVVLLPEPSYADWDASGRITTGVVLAFLLCLPAVARAQRLAQAWVLVVLWFSPWWTLLPLAFER